MLDKWIRASPKLQFLWSVPSLQWSAYIKSGPMKEQWGTRERVMGNQRLSDACGEQRLACVVRSNGRVTVVQIVEKVNAGSDRKVSEYTMYYSLDETA